MSLADDLAGDFAAFDSLELVTLTPAAGGDPIANVYALRHFQRQLPLAPLAGPFALEPVEAAFSLFTASLGDATPACGDLLTDEAGALWTIVSLERLSLGSRWKAVCRKQVS